MSNTRVTRQQLAAFIKDDRTIRAFENMNLQTMELIPDEINTLLDLINGLISTTDAQSMMKFKDVEESLQAIQETIQTFVNVLATRIREVEQKTEVPLMNMDQFQANIDQLRRRVEAIEALIGI
jgi:polyhydroxyalkanoate synthesis regulator phasin